MKSLPVLTIQPHGRAQAFQGERPSAELRIRSKWLKEVFKPGTKVRVTREMRRDKLVLVVEPL